MDMFADIILPVPLNRLFTYSVPPALESDIAPGKRVCVPFGRGRHLTGIVSVIHNNRPTEYQVKDIEKVMDIDIPTLLPYQIELIDWISRYYLCTPGDTLKMLLPNSLRPESENQKDGYRPKTEQFVKLSEHIDRSNRENILEKIKRARKQQDVINIYFELSAYNFEDGSCKPVSKRQLQEHIESKTALQALIANGILEQYQVETGRLPEYSGTSVTPHPLTDEQERAYSDIKNHFKQKNTVLLHGITSSGKTEIYIKLIKEEIERGKQVLYLLPEIALTTQIMYRLREVFGNSMCIYHSNCTDNIRAEIWQRQLSDHPFSLVLGTRSAVMLPFRNLGLVVVDEEHENSYKQEDPAPRYNARNVAIVMAAKCRAKTLLGSATPSFESYANAIWEKYGLVSLNTRYGNIELPKVEVVDITDMRKRKYMKGAFSPQLIEAITETIDNGGQVILFHNRRGYSATVECRECGWVQKCKNCDVSLTYHKSRNTAVCHYCGKHYPVAKVCPECESTHLAEIGYGTERIAEQLIQLVPQAKISIMDSDTSKGSYEDIIRDFQDGVNNVLIGTQMISKGFDFDNVYLVGILQADTMMNFPDFRAAERAYQLMEQVVGRAGRRNKRGRVIIQTLQPENQIIEMLQSHKYRPFFNQQMEERHIFAYPPYTRMVIIKLKESNEQIVNEAAAILCRELGNLFGHDKVLGPDAPIVSKVRMQHIRNIILKTDHKSGFLNTRKMIDKALEPIEKENRFRYVKISFDVDPL